jgi:signal transduction histidine kinase
MARTPGRPAHDYERLSRIEQQAQHAKHLIQQILDFSRRTVLQLEPLDLWPSYKTRRAAQANAS